MADLYVWSGTPGASSPYNSWATAAASLATALADAACTAGSTVHVAHDHAHQVTDTAIAYDTVGTNLNPVLVICEDRTTGAYATTGVEEIAYSSSTAVSMNFDFGLMIKGLTFKQGCNDISFTAGMIWFEDCTFWLTRNGSGSQIDCDATDAFIRWKNCYARFSHSGHAIDIGRCRFEWIGGGIIAGTAPTTIFEGGDSPGQQSFFRDLDFSAIAATYMFDVSGGGTWRTYYVNADNIRLNAATALFNATPGEPSQWNLRNVTSTSSVFQFLFNSVRGSVANATNCTRTGGAKYDGANGYSAKMVSTANTKKTHLPLRFKLADFWSAANPLIRVEVIHDQQGSGTGSDLQDDEFWIEIEYPDGTYNQLRNIDSTRMIINGTPADYPNSSATWTEDLTNEVKQYVEKQLSGGAAGMHTVWVYLAPAAAKTVYVCPKVEFTAGS